MKHAYPHDLCEEILRLWSAAPHGETAKETGGLPDREALEYLISTCYQVSMMTEEMRSLRFRLMLCDPSCLPPEQGPPHGFLRVVFGGPRTFHEYELIKLIPASEFESSLIGVLHDPAEGLKIWGLINSGSRWIQAFRGGSKEVAPMPDALVLDIAGAGSVRAYRGSTMLAQLSGGRIIRPQSNVMYSRWIAQRTAIFRNKIMAVHMENRSRAGEVWATVHEGLISSLYEQIIKRLISSIRNMHHGGTIVILPRDIAGTISSANPHIFVKYLFRSEDPMRRISTLIVRIMDELAKYYGSWGDPEKVVGWSEYVAASNETLLELDEALFEYARFIANLASVDGAVVFAKGLELTGFGGVIKGAFTKEDVIARAMDAEGKERETERAEGVGTRHLAAYHLCREVPDSMAIVISQDGNTRLVKWMNDFVTYWDMPPITLASPEMM